MAATATPLATPSAGYTLTLRTQLDSTPGTLGLIHVRINIAGRSLVTCVFPAQHSAWSRLDNCFRDQAVTNARQLADLLSGADAAVVSPSG